MRAWANAQPPQFIPAATQEQIERHLEFLAATLPSKNVDEESGRLRFAVYVSMLGTFSNEALKHMARRACEEYNWFPTPRQCIELASEHSEPTPAATYALAQCNRFDHSQFEEWIDGIGEELPSLDVPDHWIEIALTRTLLRRTDEGEIVTRARFRELHTPTKEPTHNWSDPYGSNAAD